MKQKDKENPSLVSSGDREIPTLRSTVPVRNSASMIDSFSHISNKNINLLYIWRGTVVYFWLYSMSH